jgi:hypothetical protein
VRLAEACAVFSSGIPTLPLILALLHIRAALSQMDFPTRSSLRHGRRRSAEIEHRLLGTFALAPRRQHPAANQDALPIGDGRMSTTVTETSRLASSSAVVRLATPAPFDEPFMAALRPRPRPPACRADRPAGISLPLPPCLPFALQPECRGISTWSRFWVRTSSRNARPCGPPWAMSRRGTTERFRDQVTG